MALVYASLVSDMRSLYKGHIPDTGTWLPAGCLQGWLPATSVLLGYPRVLVWLMSQVVMDPGRETEPPTWLPTQYTPCLINGRHSVRK